MKKVNKKKKSMPKKNLYLGILMLILAIVIFLIPFFIGSSSIGNNYIIIKILLLIETAIIPLSVLNSSNCKIISIISTIIATLAICILSIFNFVLGFVINNIECEDNDGTYYVCFIYDLEMPPEKVLVDSYERRNK